MTDDDNYPEEWLNDEPHPMDPRLSDVLEDRQPTTIDRLMVAELVHLYVSRNPNFVPLLLEMTVVWYEQLRWPTIMLALLEQFAQTALGAQGEKLTVARLLADFVAFRDQAILEGMS